MIVKDYTIKGWVLDNERLKNGQRKVSRLQIVTGWDAKLKMYLSFLITWKQIPLLI
jgi:hypothetical protein